MANRAKQEYFNQLAPRWDELPAAEGMPRKIETFVARGAPSDAGRILDVGCGTGLLVPALLERCPAALLCELDLAEEMLRVNAAKFKDRRTRCVCADCLRLPFGADRFDAVLCFGVLPHLPDVAGALGEIVRVLRPGGVLAVGHPMGSRELNAFHQSVGEPVAGDVLPPSAELAVQLWGLGLRCVAAEESADWYFVRAEKLR